MTDEFSTVSHIWDVNERNLPLLSLKSPSPLICCQYNGKQSDLLLGGCYNGQMNLYDVRKGPTPVKRSVVETSHFDPVYDLTWLQSKTGTEAVSCSSDGRLMLWDVKEMDGPRDAVWLTDGAKDDPKVGNGWAERCGLVD